MTPSHGAWPLPQRGPSETSLETRYPVRSGVDVSWVDGQGDVAVQEGVVLSYEADGLAIELPKRLADGTMIWMGNAEGELVKAAVRLTRKHELGDWQTEVRPVYRELRGEAREPVSGDATLKWAGDGGKAVTVDVRVVDISGGGVGVVAPLKLPLGQSVRLVGEQFECFCAVRHCRPLEGRGFRLGLLFARSPHDHARTPSADWLG